jgi:uncharacterized damage-inducible protein DinB
MAFPSDDTKATLQRYLQAGRDSLLWKLEDLGEYDLRRPLTPTGTNLLGLVKHVASMEAGYFGEVFGRPFPEPLPWLEDDAEDNADLWATADQSKDWVVDFYGRVQTHSDRTIADLDLDAVGHVSWWGDGGVDVSLHRVLVHMVEETARHAGHADIVRELIDGAVGLSVGNSNLPERDDAWWARYRERLEHEALVAAGRSSSR